WRPKGMRRRLGLEDFSLLPMVPNGGLEHDILRPSVLVREETTRRSLWSLSPLSEKNGRTRTAHPTQTHKRRLMRTRILISGLLSLSAMGIPSQTTDRPPSAANRSKAASDLANEPPREWIDPSTGHRVIRLSTEPGSSSLYFHQNAYT